ncbi:tetratricopeptide repeat protein [Streptomyces sp. A0958]|uniref:tetratricopeptide repeat protein n=1 Tax=Streptomyces sp. A0958 TaxID=2563101 RepID=UPI00109EA367|nr:tetratricopeptide repeat protein [Streptomyces sp. A0958]THA71593.1 tetratricopeptide repeat protein [Streptomyces sp. A0958]
MSEATKNDLLTAAVRLREKGHPEEARKQLLTLAADHPHDAQVAYQTAWVHDVLGLEAEAVPHYERSLGAEGLAAEDRRGAFLGLGSTYRILGRYADAVSTLGRGLAEFPEDGAMQTFLAMSLFNTDHHHDAMQILLKIITTTSSDPHIRQYRRAIEHYAQDLNETV